MLTRLLQRQHDGGPLGCPSIRRCSSLHERHKKTHLLLLLVASDGLLLHTDPICVEALLPKLLHVLAGPSCHHNSHMDAATDDVLRNLLLRTPLRPPSTCRRPHCLDKDYRGRSYTVEDDINHEASKGDKRQHMERYELEEHTRRCKGTSACNGQKTEVMFTRITNCYLPS